MTDIGTILENNQLTTVCNLYAATYKGNGSNPASEQQAEVPGRLQALLFIKLEQTSTLLQSWNDT